MIAYGAEEMKDMRIDAIRPNWEIRNDYYVDITCTLWVKDEEEHLYEYDYTALVICTHEGQILDMTPQFDGMDCELQFTPFEKDRIKQLLLADPDIQNRWPAKR
ncbi:hypothetical protein [Marinicrinis sediminis]|uniref:Uncharacterized protein n=1 Tax=Marinicrinis sediminis TaxID=1652465 RepID=A0ABW5RDJ9_9BACL